MEQNNSVHNAPAVSVIIPCCNAENTLGEQLDALAEQSGTVPFEVIIVDNQSTDGTAELAQGYADRLSGFRIIRAGEKQGAGYARNVGAAEARSGKILFCDADDMVSSGWVEAMSAALDRAEIVGGGRDFLRLNPAWHPHVRKMRDNAAEKEICDVHYFGKANVANVGAGNLAVNRELFLELGGFDDRLKVHEDVDFLVRAWHAGHQLHLCPEGLAYIRVRQSTDSVFRQASSWGFWEVALLKKHWRMLGWRPLVQSVLQWKELFCCLLKLRRENGKQRFLYLMGWKCGRIIGSFRFMVFAP